MVINKNKLNLYLFIIVFTTFSYLVYIYFDAFFDENKNYDGTIFFLSWLGILIAIYIFYTWYKMTGQVFSLYTIFMLFFFLFNYGHPLMWAFGIHQPNEIGQAGLYTLGKPSSSNIMYTQMLTLLSMVMFHFGAMFCFKPRKTIKHDFNTKSNILKSKINAKAIFYTCFILSLFVIPITFFNSIHDLAYSQEHGYQALYYDDNKSNIVIFNLIQRMFFPCLIGLLIGSNYKREIMYFVYIIFSIYLVVNLLSGDRGSWIYYLIILIYMSHTFYRKIKWKKMFIYSGIGILFLYLVNVIVLLRRSSGINLESIIESFTLKNSPIIEFIFEMGGSMKPALVLIQYDWDIWPYGNTYVTALVSLVPNNILSFFDIPFTSLGSWFSQNYLGISYGAGFSIIAESLINFGPIISPLFLVLLGYLVSSLTFLDKNISIKDNPFRVFFAVSTLSVVILLPRGHFQHVLNHWVYSVLIVVVLIVFMKSYLSSKIKKQIVEEVRRYG